MLCVCKMGQYARKMEKWMWAFLGLTRRFLCSYGVLHEDSDLLMF